MNQAEFFIQAPSTGTVHLRRAVLIYDGQQGSALATVHDIEEVDGEAVIGAGQAMTPRAAMDLAKALLKRAGERVWRIGSVRRRRGSEAQTVVI